MLLKSIAPISEWEVEIGWGITGMCNLGFGQDLKNKALATDDEFCWPINF